MNSVTPGWLLSQSLTIGFRPSRGRRPGTWCGLGRLAQLMVRSARGACFLVEEVIAMCMSHLDSVGPRFLLFVEMGGFEPPKAGVCAVTSLSFASSPLSPCKQDHSRRPT